MRAPEARAIIFRVFCIEAAHNVIIFKFQGGGGASAPPAGAHACILQASRQAWACFGPHSFGSSIEYGSLLTRLSTALCKDGVESECCVQMLRCNRCHRHRPLGRQTTTAVGACRNFFREGEVGKTTDA